MSCEPLLECEGAADEPAGAICRVCHAEGTDADDPLLSPCLCDGSVRWVHRSCLDEWRIHGGRRACSCELCGFVYIFELEQPSRCRVLFRLLRRGIIVASPVGLLALCVWSVASAYAALLFAGAAWGVLALLDAFVATVLIPLRAPQSGSRSSGSGTGAPTSRAAAHVLLDGAGRQLDPTSLQRSEIIAQLLALADAQTAARALAQRRAEDAAEDPGADLLSFACCLCCCMSVPTLVCLAIRFMLPPAIEGASWFVRKSTDDTSVRGGFQALAALGFAHALTKATVLVAGSLRRPMREPIRGPTGIPLVRSLDPGERGHLRAALRARAESQPTSC